MSLTGFPQPAHTNAVDPGGVATAILEHPGTLEHPAVPAPRVGADGHTGTGRPRRGWQIAAGIVVALVLGTEAVLAAPYLGTAMAAVTAAGEGWWAWRCSPRPGR